MLTDKQIEDIALKYTRLCGGHWEHEEAIPDGDILEFARAIEKLSCLMSCKLGRHQGGWHYKKRKTSGAGSAGGCFGIISKQR